MSHAGLGRRKTHLQRMEMGSDLEGNTSILPRFNVGTLPGDNPLEIGQRVGGSLPFEGTIDEVAVLNVALGEADINVAMNQGMATVT
ncbi:hypothetical protein ACFL6S_10750, partial [Candidatus Poribacteria bacterium]